MQPHPSAHARGSATAEVVMSSLHGGLQWGVDRMLSVGYGLLYDYIFEQFGPYQKLQAEVLQLVDAPLRMPRSGARSRFSMSIAVPAT